MQDPAAGGGTASGSVRYAGSAGGVSQINGPSTYTGPTYLDGLSTVKIGSDYNIGGTSGPFGLGTLTLNNSTNNILEPIGGNRTIANPVSMVFGLTVANDTGDTSSLTLSGPISMLANGRFLTNNFAASGGTLTLGSAASPSTITLPTSWRPNIYHHRNWYDRHQRCDPKSVPRTKSCYRRSTTPPADLWL